MLAIERLGAEAVVLTPSYAAYLVEWAPSAASTSPASSVERVLVAGEPGGGEPAFRARLEAGLGREGHRGDGHRRRRRVAVGRVRGAATACTSAARGFVHAELIDPATGEAVELADGATGELVLTHLRHRAAPLLRFRTRDHVEVRTGDCALRPHRPARALHRPHRRHADRARRQRLPVRRPRGRERVRAAGQRPHPRAAGRAGREAGAAAAGQRRARARRRRRTTRSPTRSASGCAACSSSRRRSSSCRGARCSAASTKSKLVERA